MDWNHFNVHCVWPDQHYEKICVTALSKEDAINDLSIQRNIKAGVYPYKVIGPLGIHKTTPKQMLAHKYRSCVGSAAMLEGHLNSLYNPFTHPLDTEKAVKWANAKALTNKQVAKVKRDIADMFKLMGLKIKHG